MIVLWGMALFHRDEHRRLPAELARIDRAAPHATGKVISGHDWRVVGETPQRLVLKRAFEPHGPMGKLRYALPIAALAVMMIWLQSIPTTVIYLLFLYLRWFVLRVEIEKDAEPVFHVMLGAYEIYEDRINR